MMMLAGAIRYAYLDRRPRARRMAVSMGIRKVDIVG